MRRFAFGLLLGSGLMFGCTPPAPAPTEPAPPAGGVAPTSGTTSAINTENGVKLVSMKVDMHCPFGCYPAVKKTLESMEGVESVTLAEQKKEGEIDNPKVYIKVNGPFDPSQAIAALAKEGFENSEVIQ